MKDKVIIGIDLAGVTQNPTGWALLKNKNVKTSLIYTDEDILNGILQGKPSLIAIDAPFSLPKTEIFRKADKEMIRRGYRVFPPKLQAMRKLTERAARLNKLIVAKGYRTIEVHPTSTRKALNMPSKDWGKIQAMLTDIGLGGDLAVRNLVSHEIDAVTAALTAFLHLRNQTEMVGDEEEGYIIIPKRQEWRTLQI